MGRGGAQGADHSLEYIERVKTLPAIALIISGCATQPLTEAERFEREMYEADIFEKWQTCRTVYKRAGATWFSTFHLDERALKRGHRPRVHQMRSDIWNNFDCRFILKKAGYDDI